MNTKFETHFLIMRIPMIKVGLGCKECEREVEDSFQ